MPNVPEGYYCICRTILACYTMSTMPHYVYYDILSCSAHCAIISQPYAILCLQSYSAHCGILCHNQHQRWSPRRRPWPRGQILKSLALASKVKSLALASRPQVLENWNCGAVEKFFGKRFLVEIA